MENPLDRENPLPPADFGCVPVIPIAFGDPKRPSWRPKAVQDANLVAKAGLRAQLGGPNAFRGLSEGFLRALTLCKTLIFPR